MLLLQDFSATNYQGIRKVVPLHSSYVQIIKKFRKVTHSSAVDGLMTIITNSPSRDVTTQNEIVSSIIDLYFVRKLDDRIIKSTRGCSSSPGSTFEEMEERAKAEEVASNAASERKPVPAPKPAAAKPAPAAPKPQPKKAARPKSVEPKPSRDEMTFAQRMVTSKEPTGENEIPGMAPAQKIIIVLALIAFIVFMVYTITGSMGLH